MATFNIKTDSLETLKPLIVAADGLTLGQVCTITGVEGSTIQNWVKRGFVARPVNKKYFERQISRILLIDFLRDCMKLETIGELMGMINGNADDTSDDIVEEEELLQYFCEIMSRLELFSASREIIEKTIASTISKYVPRSRESYEILKNALYVMVCAYISSQYKKMADKRFDTMLHQGGEGI